MLVSLVAGIGGTASADELALPKTVERDSQITAAYRFDKPATGRGFLDVEWTDVAGREVERRGKPDNSSTRNAYFAVIHSSILWPDPFADSARANSARIRPAQFHLTRRSFIS